MALPNHVEAQGVLWDDMNHDGDEAPDCKEVSFVSMRP